MTTPTERAAEVLLRHRYDDALDEPITCSCGWLEPDVEADPDDVLRAWRHHVAQVFADAGPLAAPVDGELREALATKLAEPLERHFPDVLGNCEALDVICEDHTDCLVDIADALLPIIAAHVAEEKRQAAAAERIAIAESIRRSARDVEDGFWQRYLRGRADWFERHGGE